MLNLEISPTLPRRSVSDKTFAVQEEKERKPGEERKKLERNRPKSTAFYHWLFSINLIYLKVLAKVRHKRKGHLVYEYSGLGFSFWELPLSVSVPEMQKMVIQFNHVISSQHWGE